jgi:drug/metabolite transporter (DMT)-like permease
VLPLTICTGSLRLPYQQLDLLAVEAGVYAVSNAATPPALAAIAIDCHYPLVTLVLSRAFLRKKDLRLRVIGGVTAPVCGFILLLVA